MKELFELVNDVNQTIEKLHATKFLLCKVPMAHTNTIKVMHSIDRWLPKTLMEVTINGNSADIKLVDTHYKSQFNDLICAKVLNQPGTYYNYGFKVGTMLHICGILLTKIENLKIKEAA